MNKVGVFVLVGISYVLAHNHPKVTVEEGELLGTKLKTRGEREVLAFLGVPYADPPTGLLRFKSPQPPHSWEGERDASKEGDACLQQLILVDSLQKPVFGSEDCLYLNVFTPKISKSEKLPVMFFIHGGGYSVGSGSARDYGPELLLDRNIVLVTINYRLGPLGFLSTGDLTLPGNLGLKDQRVALEWVQRNIDQFGGDRNSVTIFGESAGGASVHLHMLSPGSKGLFHAAVSQSGTALSPWAFSFPERHRKLAEKLAGLVSCPVHPTQQFLHCLMSLPAEEIVGTLQHFIVWDMDPVVLFNPAIELEEVGDAFLTVDPWTLTSSVPWMLGLNENEGAARTASLTMGDTKRKLKQLNDDFHSILPMSLFYEHTAEELDRVTEAIRTFYFGNVEKITLDMIPQLVKMYTDAFFTEAVVGAAHSHRGPVFLYYFTYNGSFSMCSHYFNNPQYLGVCHFDELLYLFPMEGHAKEILQEGHPDYVMSVKMVELWTNYARERVPKLDDSEEQWNTKGGEAEKYLLISKERFEIQEHLLKQRYQFWKSLPFRTKPSLNQRHKLEDEL